MDKWTPAADGTDFDLPPILKPLEPFKKQMTIVSGLENKPRPARRPCTPASGHVAELRAARAERQEPHGGVTIDQIAAQAHRPGHAAAVARSGHRRRWAAPAACDRNYGCSYAGTISFRTPSTPLPMETNPRKLFERLFGQGDTPQERKKLSRAVHEHSRHGHRRRRPTCSASWASRTAPCSATTSRPCARSSGGSRRWKNATSRGSNLPDVPVGVPESVDEHLNLMFDMVALAYQANLTRVFTFMMAAEVSNLTYNHIGVPDAFHPLSHHANDPAKIERLAKIQTYHTRCSRNS